METQAAESELSEAELMIWAQMKQDYLKRNAASKNTMDA